MLWLLENVPTIISGRDSDLIGVRITQTHDAREGKGATQLDEMELQNSREMYYGSKFRIMSSSFNQGEDEEVADEFNDYSLKFSKDGFPHLCEQGDNICQIKWYKEVCSRKTYSVKHWLKGPPEIWVWVAWSKLEWWFHKRWSKNELSTINFQAIGLLEGQNPNNTVHMLVSRLESTREPGNEWRWREVLLYQEFLRGGEIPTTFLT